MCKLSPEKLTIMKSAFFTTTLSISLLSFASFSQSNTVASGGNGTGTGGTVSYSIGQIDYISATGSNGSTNQGVQQPIEFFQTSSIGEIGNEIQLTLGPNPTFDNITLFYEDSKKINLQYELFDINGKLIISSTPLKNKNVIELRELQTGNYFLKVSLENNEIKSFKIIKH
jgi:opacity protein-like surface antigen